MNEIVVHNAHRRVTISTKETLEAARGVLKDEGLTSSLVSIIFVDNSYSRKLNRRYLAHPYATDVLAFPLRDGEVLEGEIYVNLDRAKIQAREHKVQFRNEVTRLVIHGLLHLLGYRDSTRKQKEKMSSKEDEYLVKYFDRGRHG